jgi:hypothetical protein
MIRVVRGVEGRIDIDIRGKEPGRGTYLCKDKGCMQDNQLGKKLERALKTGLSSDDITRVRARLDSAK